MSEFSTAGISFGVVCVVGTFAISTWFFLGLVIWALLLHIVTWMDH